MLEAGTITCFVSSTIAVARVDLLDGSAALERACVFSRAIVRAKPEVLVTAISACVAICSACRNMETLRATMMMKPTVMTIRARAYIKVSHFSST